MVVVTAWLVVRIGDDWGPATFLLFGLRWLLAMPATLLVLLAAMLRRRSLGPTLIALAIVLGPVMGFNVPYDRLHSPPDGGTRLRVLTCNMHYGHPDPSPLDALITDVRPDVIAIQEWERSDQSHALAQPEWHVHRVADFVLASRHPIRNARLLGAKSDSEQGAAVRYELATESGSITMISLHLASPRQELKQAALAEGTSLTQLESNNALRGRQSAFVAAEASQATGAVLIVGDFNTPCESAALPPHLEPVHRRVHGRRLGLGLHVHQSVDAGAHRPHSCWQRRPRESVLGGTRCRLAPSTGHR